MRRFLLSLLLALLLCVYFSDRIIGFALEPVLEKKLTALFGMPFQIGSLQANPVTGHVVARNVQFFNQPEYSYAPHLHVRELEFEIWFPDLLNKYVNIRRLILKEPFYLIERQLISSEKRSNIMDWVLHIRSWYKERKKKRAEDASGDSKDSTSWRVVISNILIQNGTFIYDDRVLSDVANRFVFRKITGNMSGFEWPVKDPSNLIQTLNMRGELGEKFPAPVEVHGSANFPTGQVSFDLEGRVHGGTLAEYRRFWSDFPIEIQEGQFDLNIRMFCDKKKVQSESHLRLYGLKVIPSGAPTDLIWGLPMTGALGFLQNQKEMILKVPVSGDITDPKFSFYTAFAKAFQDALGQKVQSGVKMIATAPVKLAEQTRSVVVQAPAVIAVQTRAVVQAPEKLATEITNKIEQIGTLMAPPKGDAK